MNLKNIMGVSGLPGLYEMLSNRPNGLMIKSLIDEKTKFAPVRKHQFTPLETVSIYTLTDTADLSDIFKTMLDQLDSNPPPDVKGKPQAIYDYFSSILPDFDRDRVYLNDIKKVIKWFVFLNERGMLTSAPEASSEEE